MALLVARTAAGEPAVGLDVAERLAEFGISRMSLLRDRSSVGIVLEGWAFDPTQTGEVVRVLFPVGVAEVRVFREVENVVVTSNPAEGGRND
jgi:hypothetical protein